MSWFFKLLGSVSGNTAEVDANNQVLVRGAIDPNKQGLYGLGAVIDDGTYTGTPTGRRGYVTNLGRLLVAQTNLLWDDTFNATAQNTGKYRWPATTQTLAQTGGVLILNSGGGTSINTNCAAQTYRSFPIFGNFETRVVFSGGFSSVTTHVANNVTEFGLFSASLPGGAAPTDGVFFRFNAANELRGVINYNGTETQTAAIAKPADNVNHDWMIVVQTDVVQFWIDRQLRGTIQLVTDAPSLGQPFSQGEQPLTIRQYIGGSAPASATKLQISDAFVSLIGPEIGRSWGAAKAGMGHMGYQGQNGGTLGTTAQLANNTQPGAAVPTNTTAALGTGLGGIFTETCTLAANTDGIISSYQNPAGGVAQTPRNLIIVGVAIDSYVSTVLATAAFNNQWSLAFGHTAVSLATAEAATTKAPRRVALGSQQPLVALNTQLQTVSRRFDGCPIVVAPGEFVATVKRNVGTVPASGAFTHNITFDCYFE